MTRCTDPNQQASTISRVSLPLNGWQLWNRADHVFRNYEPASNDASTRYHILGAGFCSTDRLIGQETQLNIRGGSETMRDYLLFIIKNALRSKRRAFLTMASVALSFCLLAVLMALYRALFLAPPATPDQALRLVVDHKVSFLSPLKRFFGSKQRTNMLLFIRTTGHTSQGRRSKASKMNSIRRSSSGFTDRLWFTRKLFADCIRCSMETIL